jgi:hypothetical protein
MELKVIGTMRVLFWVSLGVMLVTSYIKNSVGWAIWGACLFLALASWIIEGVFKRRHDKKAKQMLDEGIKAFKQVAEGPREKN